MATNKKPPNLDDSIRTVTRSIKMRGGMAPKDRLIHALVYNYFDHLTVFDQRKITPIKPEGYDTRGWVEFHGMMMKDEAFKPLRDTAEKYFDLMVGEAFIQQVTLYDKNNKPKILYVLPGTKISIGA